MRNQGEILSYFNEGNLFMDFWAFKKARSEKNLVILTWWNEEGLANEISIQKSINSMMTQNKMHFVLTAKTKINEQTCFSHK